MKETQISAKTPHYHGHRKRLKEKFLKSPESLGDYELLEILLAYSIPRKDVKPIAKELLKKFGSLGEVFKAEPESLKGLNGISDNSSLLISLFKEIGSRILFTELKNRDTFDSPENVVAFASQKLSSNKEEAFMVIYLDARNKINEYEIINEGTVNKAVVYPRNVIKNALKHNATGIILVHNHPSGESEPSGNDIHLTGLISQAAGSMDIKLLDHIIVAGNSFFSFAQENIL
jgi:DNA repair protein RadC